MAIHSKQLLVLKTARFSIWVFFFWLLSKYEQNYSNDYNNDNDLVGDAIKIKNVFDYIIAVDNEIERNKLRQK